eukprot:5796330-Amphidinium_carterae.2
MILLSSSAIALGLPPLVCVESGRLQNNLYCLNLARQDSKGFKTLHQHVVSSQHACLQLRHHSQGWYDLPAFNCKAGTCRHRQMDSEPFWSAAVVLPECGRS